VKKIGLIIPAAIVLFAACNEETPTETVVEEPQIVSFQAPRTVYQFPAQAAGLHVRAIDAQGVADLAGVTLTLKRLNGSVINTRAMQDDGHNGDILAGDGQFFTALDTALLHNQTGDMLLEAVAHDQSQNLSGVARDTMRVLAGVENRLPNILQVVAPQTVDVDTDYVYTFSVQAQDPDGASTIRFVLMEIYPPAHAQPAAVDTLHTDSGQSGAGHFSAQVPGNQVGTQCGLYELAFRAVDNTNGVGPAALQTLRAVRDASSGRNQPPLVSDLVAPATISRSAVPNTYLMSIMAQDPEAGCGDALTRVFFNSFLPSGSPATGNPFLMRDDGQGGDAVAGDGRYSLTIQITSQNATGTYRFDFQAEDQFNNLSNKVSHAITVTP